MCGACTLLGMLAVRVSVKARYCFCDMRSVSASANVARSCRLSSSSVCGTLHARGGYMHGPRPRPAARQQSPRSRQTRPSATAQPGAAPHAPPAVRYAPRRRHPAEVTLCSVLGQSHLVRAAPRDELEQLGQQRLPMSAMSSAPSPCPVGAEGKGKVLRQHGAGAPQPRRLHTPHHLRGSVPTDAANTDSGCHRAAHVLLQQQRGLVADARHARRSVSADIKLAQQRMHRTAAWGSRQSTGTGWRGPRAWQASGAHAVPASAADRNERPPCLGGERDGSVLRRAVLAGRARLAPLGAAFVHTGLAARLACAALAGRRREDADWLRGVNGPRSARRRTLSLLALSRMSDQQAIACHTSACTCAA